MNPSFQYKTVPYDHQKMLFEQTCDYQYFAFFWEMGTGKSKVTIDTIQHLFVSGQIDSVIVTAEKGYYLNWMLNEFPTHWPENLKVRFIVFSSYVTASKKSELAEGLKPIDGVLDVLIVNIESLSGKNMGGTTSTDKFVDAHTSTMFVVDESTTIKSETAGRTKIVKRIGAKCQFRRILTGTPITQSPLDVYSQCEFLRPGLLGFGSFTAFKSFYSVTKPVKIWVKGPYGPKEQLIMQPVGFRDLDDLARRLQPFSSRLLKKDCLSLPDKIYIPVYIEATTDQQTHITLLKNELMTMVRNSEITVENALSVLTKSLQIASGHVKDDTGKAWRIDSNKPEMLKTLVQDAPTDTKIIVWGYFQEDMQIIQETLSDVCPVFEVSGRVEQATREKNLKDFRAYSGKSVFLASPRVAGKSLTLVDATMSIYYSNGFNLEHRLQSEDRNHRIGQKNNVTYYDIITLNTPDVKVVKALKDKEVVSRSVLDKISSFFDFSTNGL